MSTDLYFTTNPADWTKLEGLYVSERNPPGMIQGANTSVVGFAGKCVRGPDHPVEITSPGRFLEVFGGRDYTATGQGGTRIGEVHGALLNKRFGKIVVRRVRAANAVKATKTFADAVPTNIIRVDASSVGAWASAPSGGVTVAIEDASDGNVDHFNMRVAYLGNEVLYENLDASAGNDNLAQVIGSDDARLVDVVKLADGRPANVAATALTGGSDGAIAVTDYNAAVDDLAGYPGISIVLVPEAVTGSAATFHANLVARAADVADRIFLTWAQVHGQPVATEIAQVAAQITTRSDRIWWCYNSAFTVDPDTGAEVQQGPHVWLASILSQIPVSVHAGSVQTKALLAGIKRVTSTAFSRADLIALREAGISTLERVDDGFQFRSVVTTSLDPNKREGALRRIRDYLQLSASARLRNFVKAKNTIITRGTIAAELTAFSRSEQNPETGVIEAFEIDQASVNTPAQRAQGLEKLLWRVKPYDFMLFLVFETEIGSGVVVESQAA